MEDKKNRTPDFLTEENIGEDNFPPDFEHSQLVSNVGASIVIIAIILLIYCLNIILTVCLCCVDFNVKFNKPEDSDTCSLMDMFYNFDLKQYVQCSTHTSGNTLDLIVARDNSDLDISTPTESWYISDHCFIECNLKFSKPHSEKKRISYRKIKNIDSVKFANDLQKVVQDLENISDLSELAEQYNVRISQCLDTHAPVKTKTVTVREQLPWYNSELLDIKRKKRKAEKMWRKSKNTQNWIIYKSLSQSLHNAIAVSKWRYMNTQVKDSAGDSKKLFKLIFQMMGKKKENPMPVRESDQDLAETFADYFISKIQTIRDNLDNSELYQVTEQTENTLESFREVTIEEISKIMSGMKSTFCIEDPCPTTLLKKHTNILAPLITQLVNLTFSTGNFPSQWKNAIVTPLIKKIGQDIELKSYRPVNNLPFVSKIAEKSMLTQLNQYMEEHTLLPDYLSAYRTGYSTESVLYYSSDYKMMY